MIEYVEETEICRSRMLLIYFGEKDPKDCGYCDVCLRKNETGLSNYEFYRIKDKLKASLQEQPSRRLNSLVDAVAEKDATPEKVIRVIRFMIDAGELSLHDDTVSISDDV